MVYFLADRTFEFTRMEECGIYSRRASLWTGTRDIRLVRQHVPTLRDPEESARSGVDIN